MVSTMQGLNSLFTALQTAANAFVPDSITKQSAWGSTTGTSSAPTLAERDHRADGPAGQRPLHRHQRGQRRVRRLRPSTVGSLTSTGGLRPVPASPRVRPPRALGGDAGADAVRRRAHLTVTQASGAATLTGQNVLPPAVRSTARTTPSPSTVDGAAAPTSVTLTQGVYTPDELAAEIGRASGGALAGGIDDARQPAGPAPAEGSAASLTVAADNTALGLTDTTTTAVGTDGKSSSTAVASRPVRASPAGETRSP